jgi:hypothetical protein
MNILTILTMQRKAYMHKCPDIASNKPNGMYVLEKLLLQMKGPGRNLTVGFLHAGCEEGRIGREIEGRVPLPIPALFLFCFLSSKAKQSMHQYNPHAFIERIE